MPNFDPAQVVEFVKFVDSAGINKHDGVAMEKAARLFLSGSYSADANFLGAKHTDVTPPTTTNLIYTNGPFCYCTGDLISDVTQGGSPLQNWIPNGSMRFLKETVTHLSWVSVEGYDPTQETYGEFLDTLEVVACECGPTTEWGAFQYEMEGGSVCVQTPIYGMTSMMSMRECEASPIPRVRGDAQGFPLENDAEWGIARTAIHLEQHLEWNSIHGATGSNYQWDGILELLTAGYVNSHIIGAGTLPGGFVDPVIIDGSGFDPDSCTDLVNAIHYAVRFIQQRINDRNWRVADNDVAIVMPRAFMNQIFDCVACGNGLNCNGIVSMTAAEIRSERARVARGGLGWGVIDVDGWLVPIIPENHLGQMGTDIVTGYPQVTGDVLILTRRANGMNLLEQQWLNYDQFDFWKQAVYNSWTMNGGLTKVGWESNKDRCFRYSAEMSGRMVCRMFPLQVRICDVTMTVNLGIENESGSFTHPDWYALGRVGGAGGTLPVAAQGPIVGAC